MEKIDSEYREWYVASIIVSYRLKKGKQSIFPVYENFTLFHSKNREEAWDKAKNYGKWYASIDDKLEINGKPAYTKFEGIRKIVEIIDDEFDLKVLLDGLEISYSYMELTNEKDIEDLAAGHRVKLVYVDDG